MVFRTVIKLSLNKAQPEDNMLCYAVPNPYPSKAFPAALQRNAHRLNTSPSEVCMPSNRPEDPSSALNYLCVD